MLERKKFYLTKEGLNRIKKEYGNLKKIKFSKLREDPPQVLHSDEMNPEYLSFYEDLDLREIRLAELNNILKNIELIETPQKEERNIVNLGAIVFVEVNDQIDKFEIVGFLEANPSIGRISNESPVGKALWGHKVGDKVVVSFPTTTIYKIKKIRYLSE